MIMKGKQVSESEEHAKSEMDFLRFIEDCLDEGWSSTRCPEGCIVEPDGICPHKFKSYFLEMGLI